MKNIFLISALCLMAISCQKEIPKDYAVIYGKVTNPVAEVQLNLTDTVNRKPTVIDVDQNGNFRDTIKLKDPLYFRAFYANKYFQIYLENGMDLQIDFDGQDRQSEVQFSGQGSVENNFMTYKEKSTRALWKDGYDEFFTMEASEFKAKNSQFNQKILDDLESKRDSVSDNFIASEKVLMQESLNHLIEENERELGKLENLSPGMPSPEFHDYMNYNGGTNSLSDYRGKYVYIDVWATWCAPCRYEYPFLTKIAEEFKDRNIYFVGVSVDTQKDEGKWREFIEDKGWTGIQLLADKDFDSQFMKDYYLNGVPRFILLDPKGNIVNHDAPRPSDPSLKDLFNSLEI